LFTISIVKEGIPTRLDTKKRFWICPDNVGMKSAFRIWCLKFRILKQVFTKGGNVWHEVIWERRCLWTFPKTS